MHTILRYAARCVFAAVIYFACVSSGFPAANNIVVREQFHWYRTDISDVDIYHYGEGGERLLPFAQSYAEEGYVRAVRILPLSDSRRYPFLYYNNHNEFEQTSITPVGEGTGGVTEAFKDRMLVAHTGSQRMFQYITAHETVHEIEYQYLFGGFWRSIQLLRFAYLPSWLMEGLAEYASGDLDYVTREMYLRDASTSNGLLPIGHLHSFYHVLPHQVVLAYKESEALMRYIAQEYGEDKIPQLMLAYRSSISAGFVLAGILGTTPAAIDMKFREYMKSSYTELSRGLKEPSAYGRQLTENEPYTSFNVDPAFSPDGSMMAYLSDKRGPMELYLMDMSTGKSRIIIGIPNRVNLERIHEDGTALSFSPDGRHIAFISESEQVDFLCMYNMETGRVRKYDAGIQSLASPKFAPDGRTVYLSGIDRGFRNIYSFDITTRELTRLTTGAMDDIDVAVSPDQTYIIFAEERRNPAGRIEYDLARLDLETGVKRLITSISGDERYPVIAPDGQTVYFTANEDGVNDIYRMNADGSGMIRMTTVIGGNFEPALTPDGGSLAFSSFRRTQRHIYLMSLKDAVPVQPPARPAVLFSTEPPPLSLAPVRSKPRGPYNFRVSTDVLFPFLAYSSIDGLYISGYWLLSEFLGHHQLSTNASFASAAEYLNYQIAYSYLKYRPKFTAVFQNTEGFVDAARTIKQKENGQFLQTLYPLNRFQAVSVGAGTILRSEDNERNPEENFQRRENVGFGSFSSDTTYGPYLEATSGTSFLIGSQFSRKTWGSDYSYHDYQAQYTHFFPLSSQAVSTIMWRILAGGSFGEDRSRFALGGPTRVRGLPVNETLYSGNKLLISSFEWRFPIVYNINYHMRYFFPDFFFKSFYGGIFVDGGTAWDEGESFPGIDEDEWKGSYGVSLRFSTFILQRVPLLLDLELARRFDGPHYAFYFNPFFSFTIEFPFNKNHIMKRR